MADATTLDSRATPRSRADGNARLGMAMFLGTWVMLFAALLLAYAIVRAQAAAWPPPGLPRLPRALPGWATLSLIASSVVLRAGARRAPARALGGAAALGLLFLILQSALWRFALGAGLAPATGVYASVFFAMTVFHALHVACGVVILTVMAARTAADRAGAGGNGVWLATAFWDFVGVAWLVIYGAVFWL